MTAIPESIVKTIVLVHGGFVDGSGWGGVYKILKRDGYNVSIVQNPTISLADDVAVTKRVLATHSGPVILVGHSYGGAVITEAGNDPKVAGLVYIAAFALDDGCSSTKRSSQLHSPPTWTLNAPRSWQTLKCLGASPRSLARSTRQRGRLSRVGIWSPLRTR